MLRCDILTARALEDNCTDGYDTHYVLLAQGIVNGVIEAIEKEAKVKQ